MRQMLFGDEGLTVLKSHIHNPKYSQVKSTLYPQLPVAEWHPTALVDPYKTHCGLSPPGYLATQTIFGFPYSCEQWGTRTVARKDSNGFAVFVYTEANGPVTW